MDRVTSAAHLVSASLQPHHASRIRSFLRIRSMHILPSSMADDNCYICRRYSHFRAEPRSMRLSLYVSRITVSTMYCEYNALVNVA